MIRIEIIANQSVQEELITNLEQTIPNFLYTVIPLAEGKGKASYKLGNSTWPETNFVLIAYADDAWEKTARQVTRYIKLKFPDDGVKIFILRGADGD